MCAVPDGHYPWGNELNATLANYANNIGITTPVGYFNGENGTTDGASPYGVYYMAGDLWQWTASISNSSYYVF
jgi:toxoflavin biosynthesis protein ToxD